MQSSLTALFSGAALAVSAATAAAQTTHDFNIDVAALSGTPSGSYGAAAGQTGHWNSLTGGPPYAFTLADLSGSPTTVQTSVVAIGIGQGDFMADNALTMGDDEALMDDFQDVGNGGVPSSTTWTFSGLNDATYEVYVYAWAPDDGSYLSFVSEGPCGTSTATMVGGAWPGSHVEGITYARLDVVVLGGTLEICIDAGAIGGNFASVNGFQIIESGPPPGPGTPICFGDGSGSACPCGNSGGAGEGCANGSGAGALLSTTGVPSVSADTLVLTVTNAVPAQPGLFFQGDNEINGSDGIPFGDGLRCCGMNVLRLAILSPDAAGCAASDASCGTGIGQFPGPITQHPLTSLQPGDTHCYQFWYRDPVGSACGAGFNLTNAYRITWLP